MRGGLDDALDKLARRDELRRRATGEAPGTPAAVTELVEAIAAVVARHPELGVSVGVEGAGDPLLLHFYLADGQVQVNAENAAALAPETAGPRHADVDITTDEPVNRPYSAQPFSPAADVHHPTHDDQERFGYQPTSPAPDQGYHVESDTAERRYGGFDAPAEAADPRYPAHDPGETSRDLGARLRDLGMAASSGPAPAYPPHPFAATPPPPVPPQASYPPQPSPPSHAPSRASHAEPMPSSPRPAAPMPDHSAGATRRIHPEHHRPPAEPSAAERGAPPRAPVPEQRGMPAPLAQPIPLQVERPEETELAARRLAALLRDDPSLLDQPRG